MADVEITAGICGMVTIIHAEAEEEGIYTASFRLESDCPNWQEVEAILGGKTMNVMTELFRDKKTKTLNSQIMDVSLKTIPHVSCPVISGIFKALEVSVGLALPKDAIIMFKD